MSKRNKKEIGFSNFGFSTILMAFVMICIVTISAVSLLTANSDYKLSKKVAGKNQNYYHAEEEAYRKLTEIDTLLSIAYQESNNESEYYDACAKQLSILGYGALDDTYTYSYSVPIADSQNLVVVLNLHYPRGSSDSFYQISSWQSNYEPTIHEEETLDLFQ